MFNVGHDVGGFFGPSPDPEMFCRWVQACALNPRMVMNSWKADGCNNVPWMHASVTDAVREAIALRYRLMPYLWQCFENACAHHVPIIRPSFFNFPDDLTCLDDCDDSHDRFRSEKSSCKILSSILISEPIIFI